MKYIILIVLTFSSLEVLSQKNDSYFNINNTVSQLDIEQLDSTDVGYQFWFVDKKFLDGRTLKMSVVKPHDDIHEPHSHEQDEFFFVLEGTAEFYLDGQTKIVEAYTSLYCPPNSMHSIRNVGDTELKYLVIKKYLEGE